MSMAQHNSSAHQLDMSNVNKLQNISAHQKSNSGTLPATFASNYASNSQRLSQHHKGVKDQYSLNQKSLIEQAEQQFLTHEQQIISKQKAASNKLFKNLPVNSGISQ